MNTIVPTRPNAPSGARSDKRLGLVSFPVYVGIALLVVNQRIGWDDSSGPKLLAILLRSDLWLIAGLIAAIAVAPKWKSPPPGYHSAYKKVLVYAPVAFILFTLLASVFNGIFYGKLFDTFGLGDFLKVIICGGIGLLVFNLSITNENFAPRVVQILTWAPLANILVGIFAVTTLINNIPGFNQVSDEGFGAGFIGLGGRFQGLASNPNIVMIQTSIGLSLLIPKIMYPDNEVLWKKACLVLYALGLCAVMAWTGVRAALLVWPTILLVYFWLRFRPTSGSFLKNLFVVAQLGIFVALLWLSSAFTDVQETLLSRLDGDDGRLFLWTHYSNLLLTNPLGLGLAFESIAQTDLIIEGQRLPPHNALLQAGMYAGIAGVFVSLFVLFKINAIIFRVKRLIARIKVSSDFIGLILAWYSVVVSLMFAGMLSSDFNFSILTALILASATRMPPVKRPASQRAPTNE